MKSVIFCWLSEITLSLHSPNQPHVIIVEQSLATWGRIQGDERWWWSTSNEECHLLLTLWNNFIRSFPPKQSHVTNVDKNRATWGRIQGDERWWLSTSNEECHLLLTRWNNFIPSSPKSTPRHECGQKPSHVRSHSRRQKMMMIYFKWRMSSFAESLKSLYSFIPPREPHVTNADKNLATWGRTQGDERWWWSTSNEECHLLLSHWNHFILSSPQINPTSLIWTKT